MAGLLGSPPGRASSCPNEGNVSGAASSKMFQVIKGRGNRMRANKIGFSSIGEPTKSLYRPFPGSEPLGGDVKKLLEGRRGRAPL